MPVINVQMLEGRSDEVKAKVAKEITETISRHCGSSPEHIYVTFEDVPLNNWAAGGELFSEKKKKAENAQK